MGGIAGAKEVTLSCLAGMVTGSILAEGDMIRKRIKSPVESLLNLFRFYGAPLTLNHRPKLV